MPHPAFAPTDPDFAADPYPAYARLRATGRAIWFEPSGQWLIPHHADVSALLRDRRLGRTYLHRFTHEEFGRTPPPPGHEPFHVLNDNGLLDLEAPRHTRIRRLVSKAFTPRTVEELRPYVSELAARLVGELVADGGGDLVARVAEPLPVAVIAQMLGIPESDRGLLRPWSADICGMYELNPGEDTARRAVTASLEFSSYLRELIAARRKGPGGDLISALIAAYDEGDRLSEQEMISTCVLLLNAGHEATVNTTGNAWWALFRNPHQLAALRADPRCCPQLWRSCCGTTHPCSCSSGGCSRMSRWVGCLSRAGRRWRCSSVPRTGILRSSTGRRRWICRGGTIRMCRWARASITAWGRPWPGSNSPRPSPNCCTRHRDSGLLPSRLGRVGS